MHSWNQKPCEGCSSVCVINILVVPETKPCATYLEMFSFLEEWGDQTHATAVTMLDPQPTEPPGNYRNVLLNSDQKRTKLLLFSLVMLLCEALKESYL